MNRFVKSFTTRIRLSKSYPMTPYTARINGCCQSDFDQLISKLNEIHEYQQKNKASTDVIKQINAIRKDQLKTNQRIQTITGGVLWLGAIMGVGYLFTNNA